MAGAAEGAAWKCWHLHGRPRERSSWWTGRREMRCRLTVTLSADLGTRQHWGLRTRIYVCAAHSNPRTVDGVLEGLNSEQ